MASTAHKTEEELEEHFDEPEALDKKINKLVKYIKAANHCVAFTGAGLSTSAGIPDFRGPNGVWTLEAQGKHAVMTVNPLGVHPTPGHMALVALMNANLLHFLISTNCDGVHLKSGIAKDKIAEIHGNTNIERCVEKGCEKEYMRDMGCRDPWKNAHAHGTGRNCECGGRLIDTIINFNELLWEKQTKMARENAKKADLMICMGSSLRISTWAVDTVAKKAKKGTAKLVVINLQKTPYDKRALVIHARTDDVMKMVLDKLSLEPPEWKLRRRLQVTTKLCYSEKKKKQVEKMKEKEKRKAEKRKGKGKGSEIEESGKEEEEENEDDSDKDMLELTLKGLDTLDRPFMFLKNAEIDFSTAPSLFGKVKEKDIVTEEQNFTVRKPLKKVSKKQKKMKEQEKEKEEEEKEVVTMTLNTIANHWESAPQLQHPIGPPFPSSTIYALAFSFRTALWEIEDESKIKEREAKKKKKKKNKKKETKTSEEEKDEKPNDSEGEEKEKKKKTAKNKAEEERKSDNEGEQQQQMKKKKKKKKSAKGDGEKEKKDSDDEK